MTLESSSRVLWLVGSATFLMQMASATWLAPALGTPNASTVLAQQLVQTGQYAVQAWPTDLPADGWLRAYLLPGEPLYLAAAFRWLPSSVWPYLHVPVVTLFVLAIAAVAHAAGGRRVSLLVGVLAALDPFVVYHGPVWDDTFLAAALEWTAVAVLCWALTGQACCRALRHPTGLAAIALLGVAAALTRTPSQLFLAGAALPVILIPRLRPARPIALALLVGVLAGVCGWGLRNYVVLGEVFVGTSHDGITLLESTSPAARPSILDTGTAEGYASAALADHYAAVRGMGELEANRYFTSAAWHNMASAPVDTLATAAVKIGVSLTGVDFGQSLAGGRNLVAVAFNLLLWTGAAVGVRRVQRRLTSPQAAYLGWVVLAFVGITCVLLALGPVGIRYRLTLTGAAYLTAGASLLASRPSSRKDIATS